MIGLKQTYHANVSMNEKLMYALNVFVLLPFYRKKNFGIYLKIIILILYAKRLLFNLQLNMFCRYDVYTSIAFQFTSLICSINERNINIKSRLHLFNFSEENLCYYKFYFKSLKIGNNTKIKVFIAKLYFISFQFTTKVLKFNN